MFNQGCIGRPMQPWSQPAEAARLMKQRDTGCLPVGENDRLVGMITDRDIAVHAVAEGKGPDTPVQDVMTKEVLYCFEDEDLESVVDQMGELKVRRLPVLNRDKRLVGIVALSDICRTGDYHAEASAAALGRISVPGGQHMQR
jgi:CBS domain-containing protein